MTTMNVGTALAPDAVGADLRRTARTTGLLYLGLAVTGLLGSVVIRAQLFADDDPARTLANLTDEEWLARSRPARWAAPGQRPRRRGRRAGATVGQVAGNRYESRCYASRRSMETAVVVLEPRPAPE